MSTTTVTGRRPYWARPSGSDGKAIHRSGRSSIERSAGTRRREARKTSGPCCVTVTWFLIPSNGKPIQDDRALPREARSTLITDFYSYNTNMSEKYHNLLDDVQRDQENAWMQPHWVGDLTLEANLELSKIDTERVGSP